MFFDREIAYPRRWSEMSLDFKLFFASHGALMVMFLVGRVLTIGIESAAEAALLAAIGGLATWRRCIDGWRWAGMGLAQALNTFLALAVLVVFGGAAFLLFPPSSPAFLPWYLALVNIGVFNVLVALRIVRPSREAYQRDCQPADVTASLTTAPVSTEAPWRRVARITFHTVFLLVWIDGVAFFFAEGAAAPNPESLRAAPFMGDVARALVVLQNPDVRLAMQVGVFVGIPCVLAAAFLLQFVLGVAVFPNAPARTLWAGFGNRSSDP
jgi:hypothetical protein